MLNEFKEFIMRGNVVQLAVAFIMGVEFQKIVTSLVGDIIMPIIGVILGGVDFSGLGVTLSGEAVLAYGAFIQAVINFIIIAFVVFMMIRVINRVMGKEMVKTKEDE